MMLEGNAPFDPAFRVHVLGRICARARRRASLRRAAFWITVCTVLGVFAQPLVPADTGAPGFEAIAMTVSLVAAMLLVASRPNRLPQWLRMTA
jgi:hypothetical protein